MTVTVIMNLFFLVNFSKVNFEPFFKNIDASNTLDPLDNNNKSFFLIHFFSIFFLALSILFFYWDLNNILGANFMPHFCHYYKNKEHF